MTTTDKLTDEQWAVQFLEDDAEACSAVNGSRDQTTKDARRMEVLVKRLIRERDEAHRRASQAAPAPSDALREENDRLRSELDWIGNHMVMSMALNESDLIRAMKSRARAALSTPTEERQ